MRPLLSTLLLVALVLSLWAAWRAERSTETTGAEPGTETITGPAVTTSDEAHGEQTPIANPGATAHAPAAPTWASDRPQPVPSALDATLPPVTTPLAQASAVWWAAARKGSAEAAWRLFVGSQTCIQFATTREIALRSRGRSRTDAALEEFLVVAEPFCAGIEGDQGADARESLWLGVGAGDLRALTAYVLDPPIPREHSIRLSEELVRYRENAPRIALWLLDRGYGEMAGHLALAHDGLSAAEARYAPVPVPADPHSSGGPLRRPATERLQSALGQVMPDDPALAWRYACLCAHLGNDYMRQQCALIERANAAVLSDRRRAELHAWVDRQLARKLDLRLPSRRSLMWYSL